MGPTECLHFFSGVVVGAHQRIVLGTNNFGMARGKAHNSSVFGPRVHHKQGKPAQAPFRQDEVDSLFQIRALGDDLAGYLKNGGTFRAQITGKLRVHADKEAALVKPLAAAGNTQRPDPAVALPAFRMHDEERVVGVPDAAPEKVKVAADDPCRRVAVPRAKKQEHAGVRVLKLAPART